MRLNIGPRINIGENNKFFAGLALLAGAGIALYGGFDYVEQGERLENAQQIEATITSTSIDRDTSSTRRGSTTKYEPEVVFRYSLDSNTYTSNNIYPTGTEVRRNSRDGAETFLEDYQEGADINAYVDPENPEEGFLRNEKSSKPLILLGFGILMSLMSGRKLIKI